MAKINDTSTYPNTTPALTDHVPGTDVSDVTNDSNGETVTFTFQAQMDLYEANIVLDTARIQSGTFADARIAQSNVTQHQAALSITESQISDLQSYLLNITGEPLSDLSDVTITSIASGEILKWSGSAWINNTLAEAGIAAVGHTHPTSDITSGTFADARIAETNVTQHQAALSITESQISDLQAYITNITAEPLSDLSDVTITSIASGLRLRELILALLLALMFKRGMPIWTPTPPRRPRAGQWLGLRTRRRLRTRRMTTRYSPGRLTSRFTR